MRKIIPILLLCVVLLNAYIYCNVLAQPTSTKIQNTDNSNNSSNYISGIKKSPSPNKDDPNVTYGLAFDHYFKDPIWKEVSNNSGEILVEFTGSFTYANNKTNARFQFVINEEKKSFTIKALYFNDTLQENKVMLFLIKDIFDTYNNDTNQTVPSNKSVSNSSSDTSTEPSENSEHFTLTFLGIGSIILALIYFAILNSFFNIVYFSFKAILSTFIGCLIAAWFTIVLIISLFVKYWVWIVVIVAILIILSIAGSQNTQSNE